MAIEKVAVRGGHTFSCSGSGLIINETVEDRKVKDAIIKYLKMAGKQVLDCTPSDDYNTETSELNYGTNAANEWGADLYVPIHFNNAYDDKIQYSMGPEMLIYKRGGIAETIAQRIQDNLCGLGFNSNRGVKVDSGLHDTRATRMPSVLVEVCFVESVKDCEIYNNAGPDKIGKLIAEGILGYKIDAKDDKPDPNAKRYVRTQYLPHAYEGYDGVKIKPILDKYFYDVDAFTRPNSYGMWIETNFLEPAKAEEIKNRLGSLFSDFQYK